MDDFSTSQPLQENLDGYKYEELVELLEDLTRKMSSREVGIEEATRLYSRAKIVHANALDRLDKIKATLDSLDTSQPSQVRYEEI